MVALGALDLTDGEVEIATTDETMFLGMVLVSLFMGLDKYFRDKENEQNKDTEPVIGE